MNSGTVSVQEYRVEILFPKRFLPDNHGLKWMIEPQSSTSTHACFVTTQEQRRSGREPFRLYRGKEISACCIPYFVDAKLCHSGALLDEISVVVRTGNMVPKTVRCKMKEIQGF